MKCIAGLNARRRLQDPSTIVGSFKKVCLKRLKGDRLGDNFHSAPPQISGDLIGTNNLMLAKVYPFKVESCMHQIGLNYY